MASLVIAEHDNQSIRAATLNTITVAKAAAQIAGVAKVIHADGAQFAHGLAENVAAQVLALASNYSHILFPATASGKNIAPRVAAKLDVAQISDITKVDSPDTFERPIYAGNAIATVQSADPVKVITVRTTAFDPAATSGGSAQVESASAVGDSGKSSFVGQEIAKSDRPELTVAKITVSGGRALGSSEKFHEVLEPLADKLGAAIGASRAAVDAGYAPNDFQVGQTHGHDGHLQRRHVARDHRLQGSDDAGRRNDAFGAAARIGAVAADAAHGDGDVIRSWALRPRRRPRCATRRSARPRPRIGRPGATRPAACAPCPPPMACP
jgi:electron transfer flavoprotein alpha subunit